VHSLCAGKLLLLTFENGRLAGLRLAAL